MCYAKMVSYVLCQKCQSCVMPKGPVMCYAKMVSYVVYQRVSDVLCQKCQSCVMSNMTVMCYAKRASYVLWQKGQLWFILEESPLCQANIHDPLLMSCSFVTGPCQYLCRHVDIVMCLL